MNDELIDDETLDTLPDDPGSAFVMFERACRKSMTEQIEGSESGGFIDEVRLNYMHDVIAAAQHFNIPDVRDFRLPATANNLWTQYEAFSRMVRFFTTHYRLTARAQRSRDTVELVPSKKDRVRTLIAHLKTAVDRADMPDWRKDRLRKHMADFEKALDGKRLNFAQTMVFLGLLGAGLHGIGDGAEGAAKLIHEITVLVGQSKELEDEARPALPKVELKPPIYLIEDKEEGPAQFQRDEMDDEIPF